MKWAVKKMWAKLIWSRQIETNEWWKIYHLRAIKIKPNFLTFGKGIWKKMGCGSSRVSPWMLLKNILHRS